MHFLEFGLVPEDSILFLNICDLQNWFLGLKMYLELCTTLSLHVFFFFLVIYHLNLNLWFLIYLFFYQIYFYKDLPCKISEDHLLVEKLWHNLEICPASVLSTFQIVYPSHQDGLNEVHHGQPILADDKYSLLWL